MLDYNVTLVRGVDKRPTLLITVNTDYSDLIFDTGWRSGYQFECGVAQSLLRPVMGILLKHALITYDEADEVAETAIVVCPDGTELPSFDSPAHEEGSE
jgi:hypothetical protein